MQHRRGLARLGKNLEVVLVILGHDDSCLAPRSKIRSSELVESWKISKDEDLDAL